MSESNDRWIDAHSVNCFRCGLLADERECMPGPGGEGEICPACQLVDAASPDLLAALKGCRAMLEEVAKQFNLEGCPGHAKLSAEHCERAIAAIRKAEGGE